MSNIRAAFLSVFLLSSLVSVANAATDPEQHPGGLFKSDGGVSGVTKWMVQCQGCNQWLTSTTTLDEPKEKKVTLSEVAKMSVPSLLGLPQMTHEKKCSWRPSQVAATASATSVADSSKSKKEEGTS